MRLARATAPLLPLLLAGCVSVSWTRDRRHEKPPREAILALEPGRATLAERLATLGAPLYLWEYKGDGAALAWGWADVQSKGVSLSIPVYEQTSASFSYDDDRDKLRGVVLLFGPDLVLERVRKGWLRDLEGETRPRRPAPVPASEG